MTIRPENGDRINKEIQRVGPGKVPRPVELLLRLLHHAQQVLAGHGILQNLGRLYVRQRLSVGQERVFAGKEELGLVEAEDVLEAGGLTDGVHARPLYPCRVAAFVGRGRDGQVKLFPMLKNPFFIFLSATFEFS
jgi:hypothetical protein